MAFSLALALFEVLRQDTLAKTHLSPVIPLAHVDLTCLSADLSVLCCLSVHCLSVHVSLHASQTPHCLLAEQQCFLLRAFLSPQDPDVAWHCSSAQFMAVLREHEEDD